MIEFNYETDFELPNSNNVAVWISNIIQSEGFEEGDITYTFCDDEYLHKLNLEFLNHDTLTDILSFDYSMGKLLSGEIYISVERVMDNANDFQTAFLEEVHRVLIHGILHFCGYKDKSTLEEKTMRSKEDAALKQMGF